MYTTDRQTDVRQHHRLMPPPIRVGDRITETNLIVYTLLRGFCANNLDSPDMTPEEFFYPSYSNY